MKQEFHGSVENVAGRDITITNNFRNPRQPKGTHECTKCGEYVKHGKTVCRGCYADVVYKSTFEELKQTALLGFMLCVMMLSGLILVLPQTINERFGFSIPIAWGLPAAPAALLILILSCAMGILWSQKESNERSKRPPRFIRK